MQPAFDQKAAKEMVGLCEKPFSQRPQEAGLRAVFAVMQWKTGGFDKAEDAWEHYSSNRQRFYEWKPCVTEAMDQQRLLEEALGDGEAYDLLDEVDQSSSKQAGAGCPESGCATGTCLACCIMTCSTDMRPVS